VIPPGTARDDGRLHVADTTLRPFLSFRLTDRKLWAGCLEVIKAQRRRSTTTTTSRLVRYPVFPGRRSGSFFGWRSILKIVRTTGDAKRCDIVSKPRQRSVDFLDDVHIQKVVISGDTNYTSI